MTCSKLGRNPCFIFSKSSDFRTIDNLSVAVHAFPIKMLTWLSVDEILQPRYGKWAAKIKRLATWSGDDPFLFRANQVYIKNIYIYIYIYIYIIENYFPFIIYTYLCVCVCVCVCVCWKFDYKNVFSLYMIICLFSTYMHTEWDWRNMEANSNIMLLLPLYPSIHIFGCGDKPRSPWMERLCTRGISDFYVANMFWGFCVWNLSAFQLLIKIYSWNLWPL